MNNKQHLYIYSEGYSIARWHIEQQGSITLTQFLQQSLQSIFIKSMYHGILNSFQT